MYMYERDMGHVRAGNLVTVGLILPFVKVFTRGGCGAYGLFETQHLQETAAITAKDW